MFKKLPHEWNALSWWEQRWCFEFMEQHGDIEMGSEGDDEFLSQFSHSTITGEVE